MSKYYTIQSKEAYLKAIDKFEFKTSIDLVEKEFKTAYLWLFSHYKKMFGYDSEDFSLIWFWKDSLPEHYWDEDLYVNNNKPWIQNILDNGNVLIELDLDDDTVLLTNFIAWHIPLNNMAFLSTDEVGLDDYIEKSDLYSSWERLFDEEWLVKNEYIDVNDNTIQGVKPTVSVNNITKVFLSYNDLKKHFFLK